MFERFRLVLKPVARADVTRRIRVHLAKPYDLLCSRRTLDQPPLLARLRLPPSPVYLRRETCRCGSSAAVQPSSRQPPRTATRGSHVTDGRRRAPLRRGFFRATRLRRGFALTAAYCRGSPSPSQSIQTMLSCGDPSWCNRRDSRKVGLPQQTRRIVGQTWHRGYSRSLTRRLSPA